MSKEMAFRLGLSPRAIDKHRANILRKVGVSDVVSLTRWCLKVGIVSE
jgi:DNA-binding NarL/FixJ family response regulator